jgi:hypothetical protein
MRPRRRSLAAAFLASVLAGTLAVAGLPLLRAALPTGIDVVRREVVTSVQGQQLVRLPIAASHVVLRWSGPFDPELTLALGRSPAELSEEIPIEPDDFSLPGDPEIYGEVVWADGARWARVTSKLPVEHLTVTALDTDAERGIDQAGVVEAAVNGPTVITRAGWGANESYSVNSGGYIRYSPRFAPLQKLIVHHTAGRNNDPNPAATIRAIFYNHAVMRGYGDIDYNYLIDAQGRVYEGRRAWISTPLAKPTEEDLAGNVVGGSHAKHFNEATVGIVLLGTFTSVMPTTAARTALVNLLAWKAERHGIDPLGQSTYVNPADGTTKWIYNISGHRNVSSTACPGEMFYNTFPTLRQDVAKKIASTTGPSVDHTAPSVLGLKPMVPDTTGAQTLKFGLIFAEPITGLFADDFTVSGDSPGWAVGQITGKASTWAVLLTHAGGGGPANGSVTLTLRTNRVFDKAGLIGPAQAASATVHYVAEDDPPVATLYAVATSGEPAGTSYEVTVQFNEPVTGFGLPDIQLGGTSQAAEPPWTIDRYFGQDRNFNFTVYNPSPATGTLTIQIAHGGVVDLAGNPGDGSNVITKLVDHSAPTTSTPWVRLRQDTTLDGGRLLATVAWTGEDVGPAGIQTYEVGRSYDGGAFELVGSTTGLAFNWSINPGHTYRFQVRGRDKVGNVGAWKAGPTLKPALTQQSSSAVLYTGPTATTSFASYSGGTQRYLAANGASASYTTTARSLSFVTTRSSIRGAAEIWIDGVLKATVNLNSSTTTYRFVAYAIVWGEVGTHTIKVVSVGTPARVDIDAFGVIR